MMNWGRKKPSSASSSSSSSTPHHLISHVFPLSWLSKFKRKPDKSSSGSRKTNKKEKQQQNLQRVSSSRSPKNAIPTYYWDSKLYTQDDEGFWRLSANKENTGANNEFLGLQNYCGNCKSNVKEAATKKRTQNSKVLKPEILSEKSAASKEATKNGSLQRTYRRIMEATAELHRELDEVNGYRKSVEKDMSEFELLQVMQMIGRADERLPYSDPRKTPRVILRDFGSFRHETSHGDDKRSEWQKLRDVRDFGGFHQEKIYEADKRLEWQKLKDAKINEVLLRNEKQKKSFHVGKGNSKVRVNSPRTPLKMEPCKIKALENMKKAKMKKKMKELEIQDKSAGLGSFAVVKSSSNPQQDFRNSMLEMIMEKSIRRPEELEELLACYLTLNADEYHDVIIKVFRQVWHELEDSDFNQNSPQKH